MATYMKWPKNSIVHKIPEGVKAEHAAFIEPLSCSVWAVERAEVQLEDVVVISGCGPLGLGMVAAARLKNPKVLIALDMVDWKLDIAKDFGADIVLNPAKDDVKARNLS
jgi:threonine dehydrogenase-like Zn-dependent dehydrogenase